MTTNLSLYCGPPGPWLSPVSENLKGSFREREKVTTGERKLIKERKDAPNF